MRSDVAPATPKPQERILLWPLVRAGMHAKRGAIAQSPGRRGAGRGFRLLGGSSFPLGRVRVLGAALGAGATVGAGEGFTLGDEAGIFTVDCAAGFGAGAGFAALAAIGAAGVSSRELGRSAKGMSHARAMASASSSTARRSNSTPRSSLASKTILTPAWMLSRRRSTR